MPIFTPTGLKIELSIEETFSLMTRVFPNITPFKFLKSIEGLELLRSLFAFLAGIFCFFNQFDPYTIGIVTLFGYLFGLLLSSVGKYAVFRHFL